MNYEKTAYPRIDVCHYDDEDITLIAYACVFRHFTANERAREKTSDSSKSNPVLRRFLERYERSYLDWGDDPSFFAAEHLTASAGNATWGVCRRDVRAKLNIGDFVVFFAGVPTKDRCEYYWVGVGTVKRLIRDRREIWSDSTLFMYREFLNLLVEPLGSHKEFFSPEHKDWQCRIASPYILFDSSHSRFDIYTPLHVSTYAEELGLPDRWRLEDAEVQRLSTLLFSKCPSTRRLRTSRTAHAHTKLRLLGTDEELVELRSELLSLFDSRKSGVGILSETSGPPPGTASGCGGCN